MTEQEFIEKWRYVMTGWGLYGVVGNALEGPLERAASAHRVPKEAERFLSLMFKDLQPKPSTAPPAAVKPQENRK